MGLTFTDAEIDAMVEAGPSDLAEVEHAVRSEANTLFTWDYDKARPALAKLNERAKSSQWNAATDPPRETEVDQQKIAVQLGAASMRQRFAHVPGLEDTSLDYELLDEVARHRATTDAGA